MTTGRKHPMGTGARIRYAALALGVVLAAGGCGAKRLSHAVDRSPDGRYVFEITFTDEGCPVAAKASRQNCDPVPPSTTPPPNCARVLKGDTVEFKAVKKEGTPSAAGFLLQFDPFKKGTFKPPSGGLRIDVYGVPGKHYTFNVLADPPGACTALDPQIIVD